MNNATYIDTNIQRAIEDSIREDRIVVLTERIFTQPWFGLVNGLEDLADDWVTIIRGDGRLEANDVVEIREYWGEDDDGDDWRIHVHATKEEE